MEEQIDLPKQLTDLPLPEKDLPAKVDDSASQGVPLRSYSKTNIFKNKFFWGFIGLSFLIAFLIGGFLLGKNNASKEVACTMEAKVCPDGTSVGRSGPKCEFTKCPEVTPTPDATANWKIYKGNGFTFKYLSSWKYKIITNATAGQPTITGTRVEFGRDYTQKEIDDSERIYKTTPAPDALVSQMNLFFSADKKSQNYDTRNFATTIDTPETKTIKVGKDIQATQYIWGCQSTCVDVAFKQNGMIFDFSVNNFDDQSIKILNQILSTFKFTDSTSKSTDTSAWKTYTDNKYFYSVKYPAGLEPKGESSVGPYSTAFEEIQSEPGAPILPKFYVSVIPDGFWQNGSIYNYPRADFLTNLESIQVGQSQSVIPNLDQTNTFTRLPDITVDGKTAMFFENSSPWEAKSDERILVKKTGYTYMIGAYNQKGLSEEFKTFLSTFKFTQ